MRRNLNRYHFVRRFNSLKHVVASTDRRLSSQIHQATIRHDSLELFSSMNTKRNLVTHKLVTLSRGLVLISRLTVIPSSVVAHVQRPHSNESVELAPNSSTKFTSLHLHIGDKASSHGHNKWTNGLNNSVVMLTRFISKSDIGATEGHSPVWYVCPLL